tara:strand:+ start:534 stop:782 length:249 start_codon:yes stop_codon:yes gene_type:complete
MKKLTLVLFLIISTKAFAEDKKIMADEFKDSIVNIPEAVSNFSKNEWEKTKEFQLESWAQMRGQLIFSKNKLSGFFSDLNLD